MSNKPLEVTLRVTQVLEKLGVLYLVGGSLASAMYGEPRATMDADILADFKLQHVEPFDERLDYTYVEQTAKQLGVAELLARARREVE